MMGGASLPYDAEVEYLQTTGTQYIDTGLAQTTLNMEITLDIQWTDFTVYQFETFIGYMASGDNIIPRCGLHKFNGSWMYGTNTTILTNVAVNSTRHTFLLWGADSPVEELYIDGVIVRDSVPTDYGLATNTINMYIGARNRNGSIDNTSSMKLYSAKIKFFSDTAHTTITSQLDLIPVRVGQVGYMYDRVSGQLFGNNGTGSFTLGNDK